MPLVELVQVSKSYVDQVVLTNANLKIEEGDFIVIRGRSGIGKTTLLRIVGLLDRPNSGQVLIGGRDTSQLKDVELSNLRLHKFGFVFQSFNLIQSLSNEENVELPMELGGVKKSERNRRSGELFQYFGIEFHKKKYPGEISGGEQQRVSIARALANRPQLILADEPTASLDDKNAIAVLDLFKKINKETKTAIILTTTSDSELFPSTKEFSISECFLNPIS